MNEPDTWRTLYLYKLENSPEAQKARIKTEINQQFTVPNKYFDPNQNLVFGSKKIPLKEMTIDRSENNKPTRKHVKKPTIKTNLQNQTLMDAKFENYETIDDNALKDLFESYRLEKKFCLKSTKLPPIPKEISIKLHQQEKSLYKKIVDDSAKVKISKYLSNKIHKKEKDLLINTVEKFRLKREVMDIFHHKISGDKYEKQKWNISLRRPDHFNGTRKILVNVSSDANPLWAFVKDKYTAKDRIYCYVNDIDEMDLNTKEKEKDLRKIDTEIKNYNSLTLLGKDLLQVEYDHAMQMKGQKYLKKQFECDTKHRSKYTNKTYCEHYNISNQKGSISMNSNNPENKTMCFTVRKRYNQFSF